MKTMKTILQKQTTINRRYCVRRSRLIVPTIKSNLVDDIKSRIPEIVKDRVRTVEVAAGRLAISGLLIGTVVNNVRGISFVDQFKDKEPIVLLIASSIALLTIVPNIEKGMKKDDKLIYDLNLYRFAMVMMTIIFMI